MNFHVFLMFSVILTVYRFFPRKHSFPEKLRIPAKPLGGGGWLSSRHPNPGTGTLQWPGTLEFAPDSEAPGAKVFLREGKPHKIFTTRLRAQLARKI